MSDLATTTPPAPLARATDAAPSIESILASAVERGMDPASLERLAGLYERMQAVRAEQAFAAALAGFRRDCPPIIKSSEAYNPKTQRCMYKYADLSTVASTIAGALDKHGLSYSWDTAVAENVTVTTCTLRHIEGAKHSASFTCQGAGTPIMNSAQVAASAFTFGRRYSLLGVLGLVVDADDDGRDAVPNPAPAHDTAQPAVPTREERQRSGVTGPAANTPTPTATGGVTKKHLGALFAAFKLAFPDAPTIEKFLAWANETVGTVGLTSAVSTWTMGAYEKLAMELDVRE